MNDYAHARMHAIVRKLILTGLLAPFLLVGGCGLLLLFAGQHRDDGGMAYVMAQQFVADKLVSPASATFPLKATRIDTLGPTKWRVVGYVDSQNTFGAMVRTEFSCTMEKLPDRLWQCTDLQLAQR